MAEIDGLLYLPNRARRDLVRALRIPALSEGWQGSFRELLEQAPDGEPAALAWEGLRPLRVVAIDHESASVISVRLTPADGEPAAPARPGQFLTLRVRPDPSGPPLLRTYSLSGAPDAESYRISVKREPHGAASGYLHTALRVGDVIEAGAPRGSFVLRPGTRPVVLAQRRGRRHARARDAARARRRATGAPGLVAARSAQPRRARVPRRGPRPAGAAARRPPHRLLQQSRTARSRLRHRRAAHRRRCSRDAGVPTDADFYLCGPGPFMDDIAAALTARGVAPDRVSTEIFGPGEIADARRHRRERDGAASAGGRAGAGPTDLVQSQQPVRCLGPIVREPARARRGVRRSRQVVVPDRRLPHLRDRSVSGEVSYQPDPLEQPVPGSALICCSQPSGELTLDL